VYWHHGRVEEAGKLFADCREKPDYAPFYLTRAKFTETLDPAGSVRDCRKAIDLDKKDWRAWLFLSRLYDKMDNQKSSLDALQVIYQVYPDDYRLAVPYAQALYRSQQYTECVNLLSRTDVLPFEGAAGARTLYNKVHLMLAISDIEENALQAALTHVEKSKLWPENLGAGKPYLVDDRLENYLEMLIRKRLNQNDKSEDCLNNIIALTENFKKETGPNQLISVLALIQIGNRKDARSLLEEWAKTSPDSELAFWAVAFFDRNEEDANRFFQKIKDRPDIQLYLKAVSLSRLN
jgi:tetratricopeptide (TPR) repeat protein